MSQLSDETRAARSARSWSPWGEINRILRRHGKKPHRLVPECEAVHWARAKARSRTATAMGTETLAQVLERRYRSAIEAAGYPIEIHKYVDSHVHTSVLKVIDRDPVRNLTLLLAAEHMHMGDPKSCLVYLCGRNATGWWFVSVAGTCRTVQAAWEWAVPKAVRIAMETRQEVVFAGPWFAVRTRRSADVPSEAPKEYEATWSSCPIALGCGWRLQYRPGTRWTPQDPRHGMLYRPIDVPFPARFYRIRDNDKSVRNIAWRFRG